MKNIGKPCAVKLHARFDEEGLVKLTMEWLLRHRQTKGAETDRRFLNGERKPVLYSTRCTVTPLHCVRYAVVAIMNQFVTMEIFSSR